MCRTPASVTDSRNDPGRLRAVSPAEGQGVGQVIIACVIPTKSGVVWSMCDVVVTAGLRLQLVHFSVSGRLYMASPSPEKAAASDVKQAWPQCSVGDSLPRVPPSLCPGPILRVLHYLLLPALSLPGSMPGLAPSLHAHCLYLVCVSDSPPASRASAGQSLS